MMGVLIILLAIVALLLIWLDGKVFQDSMHMWLRDYDLRREERLKR